MPISSPMTNTTFLWWFHCALSNPPLLLQKIHWHRLACNYPWRCVKFSELFFLKFPLSLFFMMKLRENHRIEHADTQKLLTAIMDYPKCSNFCTRIPVLTLKLFRTFVFVKNRVFFLKTSGNNQYNYGLCWLFVLRLQLVFQVNRYGTKWTIFDTACFTYFSIEIGIAAFSGNAWKPGFHINERLSLVMWPDKRLCYRIYAWLAVAWLTHW